MVRKLLIANRGEIAIRIIRACRELGVTSVAVYTDADRHALHVQRAEEAVDLGPDAESGYLDIPRLIRGALSAGCDAVHPGYGFLSENASFAEAVTAAGLTWVGPPAAVIRCMGDKVAARTTMQAAGVPVTPGSDGNLADAGEARAVADQIGYPVMLKATGGGGGRGIRLCEDGAAVEQQFERVRSEATRAFGDTGIFLEKAVVNPRHIEVQILADAEGRAVHLYERDCSIQRRHQKLLEIAPSPALTASRREELGALAVRAAEAAGYRNAGTVEFLLDRDGSFYFMEMNTRLQVEHPVTEAITGVDLVQAQLRVAAGEAPGFTQADIRPHGMAIEFRINAEDPANEFRPDTGRVTRFLPPGGPGVRTDSALYDGYVIPPNFDSMCAKLIVHADDWTALLARCERALDDLELRGVHHTVPYHRAILADPDFRRGVFDTGFIPARPGLARIPPPSDPRRQAALVAAAVVAHHGL